MRNVTYKYNVGDYVKFKDKFSSPSTGLIGREGTVVKITGLAPAYNNKPCYYFDNNIGEAYKESCFAGLATAPINSLYHEEACRVYTEQGPDTKCDTEDFKEA